MKSIYVAAFSACLLGLGSVASADLMIDVTGVPGSGVTTWTFSGTGTTILDGAVRTNSANSFLSGDTGQFAFGQDNVLDTSIQNQVFVFTGTASITVDGNTQDITGIFIDDDGTSADDLGVRVAAELAYTTGLASSWTGSGTVNLDINTFVLGTYDINDTIGQAIDLDDNTVVSFTAVPEPGTMAAVAAGLALLARRRRRA